MAINAHADSVDRAVTKEDYDQWTDEDHARRQHWGGTTDYKPQLRNGRRIVPKNGDIGD